MKRSFCLGGGRLPCHAPGQGRSDCGADTVSLHSLCWLLFLLHPWCSGSTGAILAESLSLFQGEICLEDIPVFKKYLDNLSAVLATEATQSNASSVSSWASFYALPVWFLPQLLHLASCAGYFLLMIFSTWYLPLEIISSLFTCLLPQASVLLLFSPPSTPKTQAGAVLHLLCGGESVCACFLCSRISLNTRMGSSSSLTEVTVSYKHNTNSPF